MKTARVVAALGFAAFVFLACNGELRLGGDGGSQTVSCQASSPCPFSLPCVSSVCVECNADGDCHNSGLGRCDLASHRCVQCGATADCEQGFVCESQTKRCVRGCTMSSMCTQEGYRDCDLLRGYCVACATNAQCSDGKICDTRIGQCVDCVSDSDCIDPEKKRCDPVTSHCVKCLDNLDCKADAPVCNLREHECGHPD